MCPGGDPWLIQYSMSARCPHTALGRFVAPPDGGVHFTTAYAGQCDCYAPLQHVAQHRAWLRYVDHSSALQFGEYLSRVYELPSLASDQIDASRLHFFWSTAPRFGQTLVVWWACLHCNFEDDVIWAPFQDAQLDPCTAPEPAPFPGFFVHRPYAVSIQLTGVSDDHWVEVMRIARISEKPDAVDQSSRGQVWFWLAVGSGIWWNVGKSKRLLASDDRDLAHHVTCAELRQQGYDSIQRTEFYPAMALELIDCRGALLEAANETWERACPPLHVELRAGIPPEPRHAPALRGVRAPSSRPCVCNVETSHVDCLPAPPSPHPRPPASPASDDSPPEPLSARLPLPNARFAARDVHLRVAATRIVTWLAVGLAVALSIFLFLSRKQRHAMATTSSSRQSSETEMQQQQEEEEEPVRSVRAARRFGQLQDEDEQGTPQTGGVAPARAHPKRTILGWRAVLGWRTSASDGVFSRGHGRPPPTIHATTSRAAGSASARDPVTA